MNKKNKKKNQEKENQSIPFPQLFEIDNINILFLLRNTKYIYKQKEANGK